MNHALSLDCSKPSVCLSLAYTDGQKGKELEIPESAPPYIHPYMRAEYAAGLREFQSREENAR